MAAAGGNYGRPTRSRESGKGSLPAEPGADRLAPQGSAVPKSGLPDGFRPLAGVEQHLAITTLSDNVPNLAVLFSWQRFWPTAREKSWRCDEYPPVRPAGVESR